MEFLIFLYFGFWNFSTLVAKVKYSRRKASSYEVYIHVCMHMSMSMRSFVALEFNTQTSYYITNDFLHLSFMSLGANGREGSFISPC